MDKLALMKSLKLSDEDSIQLLIKGIGSFALRKAAATLRIASLNQFLREMHIITAISCNRRNRHHRKINSESKKKATITTYRKKKNKGKDIRKKSIRNYIVHTATKGTTPKKIVSS